MTADAVLTPPPPAGVVEIHTDGACLGNPGFGGWGAVLRYHDAVREISGAMADTTNNRMELLAAIEALRALRRPSVVHLYTDSEYVKNGITKWVQGWQARGWKTADKKPVKNQDLWEALMEAVRAHTVTWFWVRGHAGHPLNEQADTLARDAATRLKKTLI